MVVDTCGGLHGAGNALGKTMYTKGDGLPEPRDAPKRFEAAEDRAGVQLAGAMAWQLEALMMVSEGFPGCLESSVIPKPQLIELSNGEW